MSAKIQIVILAAGRGYRMGQTKQLLPYLNRTLLGSVVELAESIDLGRPAVVLGHDAERIENSLADKEVDLLINPNWSEGMGNTLAFAIKNMSSNIPTIQAVLVLLADQPKITKSHLLRLVREYRQKESSVIATAYPNGGGVPAVFDKSVFPSLLQLEGDKGARQVIRNQKDAFLLSPKAEEVKDIDSPQDYRDLLGEQ